MGRHVWRLPRAAILAFFTKDIADSKAGGVVFAINPKTDVGVSRDMVWESGTCNATAKGAVVATGKFLLAYPTFVGLQKSMALPATLRASRNTDAGLFYDVTEQTMRVHVIAAGGAWEEEPRRREAAEDSVNPGASVIVVGDVDAGILIVERLPSEVRLLMLCLLPTHQGRGIGSSLVSALQGEAAARRIPLLLDVLKVNPARRFYERLGFGVDDESEYFFHMRYSS